FYINVFRIRYDVRPLLLHQQPSPPPSYRVIVDARRIGRYELQQPVLVPARRLGCTNGRQPIIERITRDKIQIQRLFTPPAKRGYGAKHRYAHAVTCTPEAIQSTPPMLLTCSLSPSSMTMDGLRN